MASVITTPNDPLRDFMLLTTRAPGQKPWFPEEHTLAVGPLTYESRLPLVCSGLACRVTGSGPAELRDSCRLICMTIAS